MIPTYNRVSLLDRAVRSVIAQCEPGDEVIVVDDGSTDGTDALVRSYGEPVRYVRTDHTGAGAARNAGVAAARGDLVAFLDSDDEWMPGKLPIQRAIMQALPGVVLLFSDYATVSKFGVTVPSMMTRWRAAWKDQRPWSQVLGREMSSLEIGGLPSSTAPFQLYVGRLYESAIRHFPVSCCAAMVRRAVAGDDVKFAEDLPSHEEVEYFARLSARGAAAYMDRETFWNHGHDGPRLTDTDDATRWLTWLTVTERVWGADPEYLGKHRDVYEGVMDRYRERAVRELLDQGRSAAARRESRRFFRARPLLSALGYLPGPLMRRLYALWRRLRAGRAPG